MRKVLVFLWFSIFTASVYCNEIGMSCASDLECDSLCCNQSTGACSPHDPRSTTPIFCSKPAGQSCITSEFCASEVVVECKIVKTGYKADGSIACSLQCPSILKPGRCIDHACYPPATLPIPTFDPNDCSKAVDP